MLNSMVGLASVFGSVWMMRQDAFDAMSALLASIGTGRAIELPEGRGLRWAAGGGGKKRGSVAVMGLYGMIDKRSSWMMDVIGGTSTDAFGATFDELVADPQIKGIVIDCDTPGGSAVGTFELSKKIFDARSAKPIVAISNAEMNSAGYYIASAASKVFVTPSASTGSIGVWSAAAEYSKQLEAEGTTVQVWKSAGSPFKAELLPWKQFTQEAIDYEQTEVDRIYAEFSESVARNRGISAVDVRKNFGQGRAMGARAAVAAGLADRVATLEDVCRRMDAGRLDMSSQASLDASFDAEFKIVDELPVDEPWRDVNATEAARSRLRRKGILA